MYQSTTRIFEIYIRASAEAVWEAVTTPHGTARYGHRTLSSYDLRPRGAFRVQANDRMREMGLPDVIIDGEVLEAEPPRRLVQTYRFLISPEARAEGFTRVVWDLAYMQAGFTRLAVTHDVAGAPIVAQMVTSPYADGGGGGWSWILSDLKTLLETGASL